MRILERYFARIDGGHGKRIDQVLSKLYLQLNFNPVKFTVSGFYEINLNLFASVSCLYILKKIAINSITLSVDNNRDSFI